MLKIAPPAPRPPPPPEAFRREPGRFPIDLMQIQVAKCQTALAPRNVEERNAGVPGAKLRLDRPPLRSQVARDRR